MAHRSYDAPALEELLPHRYPFLLVDRIDVVEPGKRVVGFKRLTAGEWWAESNGNQAMPLTLVLEALAQTSGALIPDLAADARAVIPYFVAADRVRLRRPVKAGELIQLEVSLLRWRSGLCKTHGIATVDGALVLSANVTAMLQITA